MKKCKICGLEYEEEKCPNCSREITDPLVLIARQNIINKRRRNKIALLVCSVLLVVFLFLFTAAYIIGHIDYSPSSSSRSTSTLSPSSTSTPIPETSDTTNSTSYPSPFSAPLPFLRALCCHWPQSSPAPSLAMFGRPGGLVQKIRPQGWGLQLSAERVPAPC